MTMGFILVDKPSGPSSYDMIRIVKKYLDKHIKIGHAGTLDPLASGLLIIGIGREATRALSRVLKFDKTYKVTAILGRRYDTQDITGKLLEEKGTSAIFLGTLKKTLLCFRGEQQQVPPMYSAAKYQGAPLYKLARRNKTVERKSKKITVYSINLISWKPPYLTLKVKCSSGTYIRTLVDDIGKRLSVGASVSELRRTQIGPFSVDEAVKPEKLNSNNLKQFIIDKDEFLLRE